MQTKLDDVAITGQNATLSIGEIRQLIVQDASERKTGLTNEQLEQKHHEVLTTMKSLESRAPNRISSAPYGTAWVRPIGGVARVLAKRRREQSHKMLMALINQSLHFPKRIQAVLDTYETEVSAVLQRRMAEHVLANERESCQAEKLKLSGDLDSNELLNSRCNETNSLETTVRALPELLEQLDFSAEAKTDAIYQVVEVVAPTSSVLKVWCDTRVSWSGSFLSARASAVLKDMEQSMLLGYLAAKQADHNSGSATTEVYNIDKELRSSSAIDQFLENYASKSTISTKHAETAATISSLQESAPNIDDTATAFYEDSFHTTLQHTGLNQALDIPEAYLLSSRWSAPPEAYLLSSRWSAPERLRQLVQQTTSMLQIPATVFGGIMHAVDEAPYQKSDLNSTL